MTVLRLASMLVGKNGVLKVEKETTKTKVNTKSKAKAEAREKQKEERARALIDKEKYKGEKARALIDKAKTTIDKASSKSQNSKQPLAPHKLILLITVVPRAKADFYVDLLQAFEVNMQMEVSAFGTARKGFGLLETDLEKQVIFSVIRDDKLDSAVATLEDKFATIRGGKGVTFAVPFTSIIGVASYQFLSNKQ